MTTSTTTTVTTETDKPTNGLLVRSKGFAIKAYHLAWCNPDGTISPVKVAVSAAVVGYLVWFNPWLVVAFFELFVIFSFMWFMFKLLVGRDIVEA